MGVAYISALVAGGLLLAFFLLIVFLNVVNYVKDRRAYARDQGLKRSNLEWFRNIRGLLKTFSMLYPQYVEINLTSKSFYIMNRIALFEDPKTQNKYLRLLYDRLFESGARLKEDFYDVMAITAPLNNLLNEIERELNK